MTIRPINDNIVVEITKAEKVSQNSSGIFIVNKDVPKEETGTIVAVGHGRVLNNGEILKPEVKVGDNIIFDKFAGTELKIGDKTYLIIKENNILCII